MQEPHNSNLNIIPDRLWHKSLAFAKTARTEHIKFEGSREFGRLEGVLETLYAVGFAEEEIRKLQDAIGKTLLGKR